VVVEKAELQILVSWRILLYLLNWFLLKRNQIMQNTLDMEDYNLIGKSKFFSISVWNSAQFISFCAAWVCIWLEC